ATLEFLDQETVKVVEDFAKIGLPTEAKAVLLIEQDGPPEVVSRDAEKIEAQCKENHEYEVQIAETDEQAEELTEARRYAITALYSLKPSTIVENAPVTRSEIPKMV